MSLNLPIYIVSLPFSERRNTVKKELNGEEVEFIDAIIGKDLPEKKICEINSNAWVNSRYNRKLGLGEIGCALSHRKIYEKMVNENIEWAIIFEDDIYLKHDFFSEINKIKSKFSYNDLFVLGVQEGLKSQDYILLSEEDVFNLSNGFSLKRTHHSEKYIYRTAAYIISKTLAKRILDFTSEKFCCADDWYIFTKYNLINNIYMGDFVGHPEDISSQSLLEAERKKLENKGWKDNFSKVYLCLRYIKIFGRKIVYGVFK